MNDKTRRVALSGLLTALMLVLGYLESLLPLPFGVPGIKLGLSNSVLLYAVYALGAPITWLLMLVKMALSGLLFGSPSAMLFSLAGGALSVAGMLLCRRFLGVMAVSVAGAVLHGAGQVLVAALTLGGRLEWLYYLAVLALAGVGTGLVTGAAAALVLKSMRILPSSTKEDK